MSLHNDYKFSVTIHSDDLSVIACLRGLSFHCQDTGSRWIPSGGTKRVDWQRDGHEVTFHFSTSSYRHNFIEEAKRLFPTGRWKKVRESENDPAKPQ